MGAVAVIGVYLMLPPPLQPWSSNGLSLGAVSLTDFYRLGPALRCDLESYLSPVDLLLLDVELTTPRLVRATRDLKSLKLCSRHVPITPMLPWEVAGGVCGRSACCDQLRRILGTLTLIRRPSRPHQAANRSRGSSPYSRAPLHNVL
jgi:hypothetical protein